LRVSLFTEARDRGQKFEDFECHGVGEYWIVDGANQSVEQYVLRAGSYQLLLKSGSGEISGEVVKGFRIPIGAIFEREANLAALKQLLSA